MGISVWSVGSVLKECARFLFAGAAAARMWRLFFLLYACIVLIPSTVILSLFRSVYWQPSTLVMVLLGLGTFVASLVMLFFRVSQVMLISLCKEQQGVLFRDVIAEAVRNYRRYIQVILLLIVCAFLLSFLLRFIHAPFTWVVFGVLILGLYFVSLWEYLFLIGRNPFFLSIKLSWRYTRTYILFYLPYMSVVVAGVALVELLFSLGLLMIKVDSIIVGILVDMARFFIDTTLMFMAMAFCFHAYTKIQEQIK